MEKRYDRRTLYFGSHAIMYASHSEAKVTLSAVIAYRYQNVGGGSNVPKKNGQTQLLYDDLTVFVDEGYWIMRCVEGIYQTIKITASHASLRSLIAWWQWNFGPEDGKRITSAPSHRFVYSIFQYGKIDFSFRRIHFRNSSFEFNLEMLVQITVLGPERIVREPCKDLCWAKTRVYATTLNVSYNIGL